MGVRFQAGGPAQYAQACKLSRKLFVDNLNIYLVYGIRWDILAKRRNSMKVKINIEWRKSKQEPEAPEYVIRDALKMAGWTVGHIEVQGVWDEDKPATPQGPWNQDRLPHEWIVDGFLTGK